MSRSVLTKSFIGIKILIALFGLCISIALCIVALRDYTRNQESIKPLKILAKKIASDTDICLFGSSHPTKVQEFSKSAKRFASDIPNCEVGQTKSWIRGTGSQGFWGRSVWREREDNKYYCLSIDEETSRQKFQMLVKFSRNSPSNYQIWCEEIKKELFRLKVLFMTDLKEEQYCDWLREEGGIGKEENRGIAKNRGIEQNSETNKYHCLITERKISEKKLHILIRFPPVSPSNYQGWCEDIKEALFKLKVLFMAGLKDEQYCDW